LEKIGRFIYCTLHRYQFIVLTEMWGLQAIFTDLNLYDMVEVIT